MHKNSLSTTRRETFLFEIPQNAQICPFLPFS